MAFYFDESREQDHVATPREAVREWAYNCGGDPSRLNSQWLLHDFDVWVRNPHYLGPEQRHPDDERNDDDETLDDAPTSPSAAIAPAADHDLEF